MSDILSELAEFIDKAHGGTVRVLNFTLTLDDGCDAEYPFGCCSTTIDVGELIELLPCSSDPDDTVSP